MKVYPVLQSAVKQSTAVFTSLVEAANELQRACDTILQCLSSGHKLLVCGNGGSAADASHFATEFVVRFSSDRRSYPAISLTSDGALLTAAANDYGFDEVFARQVAAFGNPGHVLICLYQPSQAIVLRRALEQAKASEIISIAFLGRDGGRSLGLADIELVVRAESAARIQEAHIFLLHVVCEALEPYLAQKESR